MKENKPRPTVKTSNQTPALLLRLEPVCPVCGGPLEETPLRPGCCAICGAEIGGEGLSNTSESDKMLDETLETSE